MKKSEPDRTTTEKIGALLQSTRKHLGMNQTALAPQLGLDQSALSRVESGKQMLTATQWFMFTEIAGISPDAPIYGLIELNRPESAMRLPSRYAFEKHTKVRSLLPMLHYARNSMGDRAFQSFLAERRVSSEYFINLNASINYNFVLDLSEALVKRTGIAPRDAETVTRTAAEKSMHGSLHHYYDRICTDQIDLMSGFVSQASDYGTNFKYEVLENSKSHMDVAVVPMPHMKEFNYRNHPVLSDFFAHYDKGLLENFSAYGGQKPVKVSILENHYKGDARCLYRVKSAVR